MLLFHRHDYYDTKHWHCAQRISFAEGNGGGLEALRQDTVAIYEVTQPPFILAKGC